MRLVNINESPQIRTLKDNQKSLTDDERNEVISSGGTWSDGRPAVRKSVINGKTWFFSTTHRCYAASKTIEQAVKDFKKTVEPSS